MRGRAGALVVTIPGVDHPDQVAHDRPQVQIVLAAWAFCALIAGWLLLTRRDA
jgi:hypothetical protein